VRAVGDPLVPADDERAVVCEEALWPVNSPGRPQTAIQGYVSHLRKVLAQEAIVTDASGYRLNSAATGAR
jgi:DNA-binding SARP family transcriptional activator